jgi:hypothetical protein
MLWPRVPKKGEHLFEPIRMQVTLNVGIAFVSCSWPSLACGMLNDIIKRNVENPIILDMLVPGVRSLHLTKVCKRTQPWLLLHQQVSQTACALFKHKLSCAGPFRISSAAGVFAGASPLMKNEQQNGTNLRSVGDRATVLRIYDLKSRTFSTVFPKGQ